MRRDILKDKILIKEYVYCGSIFSFAPLITV